MSYIIKLKSAGYVTSAKLELGEKSVREVHTSHEEVLHFASEQIAWALVLLLSIDAAVIEVSE